MVYMDYCRFMRNCIYLVYVVLLSSNFGCINNEGRHPSIR